MAHHDKECGVYMFFHPATQKAYIGSAVNLAAREASHRSALNRGDHGNKALQAAYNQDPNLQYYSVPLEDRETAFDAEQALINTHYPQGVLFNRAPDARYCGKGLSPSEETRQKMSQWQVGKKHSPETLQKLREKAQGRVPSPAALEAARAANLGRKHSEEQKERAVASKRKPVEADGVVYESLTAAANAAGITLATAHNRIHTDNPQFANWRYLNS